MATVGDVADRLGLLTLTPGPAGRTRRLRVSRVIQVGGVPLTAVTSSDVVCVGGAGWKAVGEPESFAAAIRERGVPAIVVDTDDDRLSAEFVSSCVQHGVPIYMLPRERTFADLLGCFAPQTSAAGGGDSDAGQVSAIIDVLADFHRKSGITGAVVLRGAFIARRRPRSISTWSRRRSPWHPFPCTRSREPRPRCMSHFPVRVPR